MNDTHGETGKGWYGFDLDGTLAKYDGWKGIDRIGEPVKPMVDLIKRMHAEGKVVKILTARVSHWHNVNTDPSLGPDGPKDIYDGEQSVSTFARHDDGTPACAVKRKYASDFIREWCEANLGFIPEITHEKDHLMLELYDDRVKQVVQNEGFLVEDLYRECGKMLKEVHADNGWLLAKLNSKFNGFWAGLWMGVLSATLIFAGIEVYDTWFKQKEPARVRFEAAHKVLCDLVNDWPEDSQSIRTSEVK